MATTEHDRLLLTVDSQFKGLERANKFAKQLDKVKLGVSETGEMFDNTTGKVVKTDQAFKRFQESNQQVEKDMGKLNAKFLGLGLAMLFTGMALKRLGDTIIRSLSNAFMLLADESNAGVKGVMALQAGFQFLKFIIFDTFANSELFASFVEFIVNLINKVSEFIQLHPEVARFIVVFSVLMIIIGAVTMVIGQLTLAAIGLSAVFGLEIGAMILGILGFIAVLALLVAIWTSDMPIMGKVLITALVLLGLLFLGVSPIIIILTVLIGTFVLLAVKLGGVGKAFKALGIFALAVLALIGDAIIEFLISPLRLVVAVINLAIRAMNKMGANIALIPTDALPEVGGLSKRVFEMRNKLLLESEQAGVNKANEERGGKFELGDLSIEKLTSGIGENVSSSLEGVVDLKPSTGE